MRTAMDLSDLARGLPKAILKKMHGVSDKVVRLLPHSDEALKSHLSLPGEVPDALFYRDFTLRFGAEDTYIWVIVEPVHKNKPTRLMDRGYLQDLLDDPSSISQLKSRSYRRIISTGKVFGDIGDEAIKINYFASGSAVKKPEDAEEALWYYLRPVFKVIDDFSSD